MLNSYHQSRINEIKKILNDKNISSFDKNKVLQCEAQFYLNELGGKKEYEYFKALEKLFNDFNKNSFVNVD